MSSFIPFWLLIAPPILLFIDSLMAAGGHSAMGSMATAGTAPAGVVPRR